MKTEQQDPSMKKKKIQYTSNFARLAALTRRFHGNIIGTSSEYNSD